MSARPTYRPGVEPLESRELPAASAYLSGGALVVSGTSANDYLSVSQMSGRISVYGASIWNGVTRTGSVDAAAVTRVYLYGFAGNDTIIASSLDKPVIASAGAGNDSIFGGASDDYLDGGTGDDTIFGAAGDDRLIAGVAVNERDSLLGGGDFDWYYRPINPTSPIVGGTSATDIRQGEAPLCQSAASLAEAAAQGFNFAASIRTAAPYLYDIKLYGNASSQRVYFDGWTNDQDLVAVAPGEFWSILFQRARLQSLGIDPNREYTRTEWNAWNDKTNGRLYSIAEALYQFTGAYPSYRDISTANAAALQSSLARGDYLIAQSQTTGTPSAAGIVRNHAYAILGVYQDAGGWRVKLYNPWGKDQSSGATMDALAKTAADDGMITLSWSQFVDGTNFRGYFQAP